MRARAAIVETLRCPVSGERLAERPDGDLEAAQSGHVYPAVRGVPILVSRDLGPFDPAAYESASPPRRSRLGRLARVIPVPVRMTTRNVGSDENFRELTRLLREEGRTRVLVVGGAVEGAGISELLADPALEVVETDVTIGPRTTVVCDAHHLPFADGSFDAVVCQGVLGVLTDPAAAVAEMHRVLAPGGLVYSEAPFMQHVFNGASDFTRWTHAGHLHLFRDFEPLTQGVQNGPGMMLAWSLRYFLMSFAGRSRAARLVLNRVGALLGFWLVWLDGFLVGRPAAADAAAGTFLIARRRSEPPAGEGAVPAYRGMTPTPTGLVV